MLDKLERLREHGQSIWYDNIQRLLIENGGLEELVAQGVRGLTSNPSIFERAIAGSDDYDLPLLRLALLEQSTLQIYEALVLEDIRDAAEILRPVYEDSQGLDGYVSLEVAPTLAHDTEGTIREAVHLFEAIGAPNVMIKVPATEEGIPAIADLIGQGINVNVTLIFGLSNYRQVANAYIEGLEHLIASGGDPKSVASVASFFVSRVDTMVDRTLDQKGIDGLRGKAGIANSKLAYQAFRALFSGDRWDELSVLGGRPQRPLWASTSTKDPRYPDTMYVEGLIGPETVNTVPPATLDHFIDHGEVAETLSADPEAAQAVLRQLEEAGVDMAEVTRTLQQEGVRAFTESYEKLLDAIAAKSRRLMQLRRGIKLEIGDSMEKVESAVSRFEADSTLRRIWDHDYTVWKPAPDEITNRLGWLDLPKNMRAELQRLRQFADQAVQDGFTHAVLLGMGGSSLAPDVFQRTFGTAPGFLQLTVLDSTHPDEIQQVMEEISFEHTLFIVSTKSGSTVETLSLFRTMFNRVQQLAGKEIAGSHFVGVTDPGSPLEAIARKLNFRDVFLNDPNIGGRYSALSFFGLVPAALIGLDLDKLLSRARSAEVVCHPDLPAAGNPAAQLGVLMGELALAGRDKLTLVIGSPLQSFADWLEQLLAESTGKEGKGILPVAGEALLSPDRYRQDRLFVWIRTPGDAEHASELELLRASDQPVVEMSFEDTYDLGALMFIWELATAIAGERMGINPFNQPNVESAKIRAREMVAAYEKSGKLPEETPVAEFDGVEVYAAETNSSDITHVKSTLAAVEAFLAEANEDAYVSLQAYLQPTEGTRRALQALRTNIQERTRRAVTLGFGPRFLHSTGQLHKGDAGHGMFIQVSGDKHTDIAIPEEAGSEESEITFGVLIDAQVRGDFQALIEGNRAVLRLHLSEPVEERLRQLAESF